MILKIKNLCVSLGEKKILENVGLEISENAHHLLTGHNGSGKSSLVQTIAGNPEYEITSGEIEFMGANITNENTTRRALLGIFLGAQNVPEIPGLTVISFLKNLKTAHTNFETGKDMSMADFMAQIESARTKLNIPKEWLSRSINVGFSGGERKKLMLLRLVLTNPKLAILDEPDSGADADVQKLIIDTINEMPNTTFLIISHQDKFKDMYNASNVTTLSAGQNMI